MCILFVAVNQHPDYPLVIAANRDEYYARESRSMHWWQDKPDILAGRDLQAGGTWLGVNRHGRFAAVTNYRDPGNQRHNAESRGNLPTGFLEGHQTSAQFGQNLQAMHQRYNPFNLIFGDRHALHTWDHQTSAMRELTDGCYSVSNGSIDQQWPKMSRGVSMLRDTIRTSSTIEFDKLLPIMCDQQRALATELPDTGITMDKEVALSSIFIHSKHYGTRTTTILLYRAEQIQIAEFNYGSNAQITSSGRYNVTLP